MNQYSFALGTNHTLSKIDIVNILLRKGVDFEILEASEEVLIISTDATLDAAVLIDELGSAAKVGEIVKKLESKNFSENRPIGQLGEKNLEKKIKEVLGEKFGVKFGLSVYGAGGKLREVDEIFREIRNIGWIGEVRGKERVLSTVAVDKNNLLTEGIEIVICVGRNGIYVGRTLAIQDYEGYSLRDYGRPGRDTKSGMIPPKLAKMMINLAGRDKNETLLDPFCGSGTILQEMLLLGYQKIIGSDLEQKAIEDTRENLAWLREKFSKKIAPETEVKLIKSDVRSLSSKIPYKSISAIVTEPYLGSSKSKTFNLEKIQKEIKNLEQLYLAAFLEFKKLLKDKGEVVIIFPVFKLGNHFLRLEILEQIKQMGFIQRDFLEGKVEGAELLKLQVSERNSVVYFRPGQTVSREIFVFTS